MIKEVIKPKNNLSIFSAIDSATNFLDKIQTNIAYGITALQGINNTLIETAKNWKHLGGLRSKYVSYLTQIGLENDHFFGKMTLEELYNNLDVEALTAFLQTLLEFLDSRMPLCLEVMVRVQATTHTHHSTMEGLGTIGPMCISASWCGKADGSS